jgi:hypothetical protein
MKTEYSAGHVQSCTVDFMAHPFFTNAPCGVTFVGGDPQTLREVQAVELSIGGDAGLGDRLNDSLLQRKNGIYGFPIKKEVFQFWNGELTTRG